jgi:DNA-binding MarR family transcriptional regulator
MTGDATATSRPAPTAPAASGRPETVATVADSFSELQRTVRRAKARLLAASDDVDSATRLLLHTVAGEGPMRASALAASVQADLSTVSRQVTTLVARGFLARQADQLDGRACLLAVTDAGRAAITEHEQRRQAFFDAVLADWSAQEMRQFAQELERFAVAYDQVHISWMRERTRRPDDRPEGSAREGSAG